VWTPNIQKTNLIEKSFSSIIIQYLYGYYLKKLCKNNSFDLIIYSTPPITFNRLINEYRVRFNVKTYLLLKDIFPQNAVDLKIMSSKGIIYKYFKKQEQFLYRISDWIGTMSEANRKYLINENPWIDPQKVEINPNSIEVVNKKCSNSTNRYITDCLKEGKIIFVYGGNLGKPQGVDFLLEVIKECEDINNAYFLIVGTGTESNKILKWFDSNIPKNAMYINELARDNYDELLTKCHVGLVFLNKDFSIPNYPSRILPYMKNKLPVLLATDIVTDVGKDAEENEYGLWCLSGDVVKFKHCVEQLSFNERLRKKLGENAYYHLNENFSVDVSYKIIWKHFT